MLIGVERGEQLIELVRMLKANLEDEIWIEIRVPVFIIAQKGIYCSR
jgi:hypothetical protein